MPRPGEREAAAGAIAVLSEKTQHEQPKDVRQGRTMSPAGSWEAGAYTLYGHPHPHMTCRLFTLIQFLGPLTKLSAVFL